MDEQQQFRQTTPFDELVSNRPLQLLKCAIPYLDPANRQVLSFYVKLFELNNTFHIFSQKNTQDTLSICSIPEGSNQMHEMVQALKPYCTPSEAENLDLFSNLFTAFHLRQKQKEGKPDSQTSNASGSPFDISSLLGAMLTPEQQTMFDLLAGMNS